MPKLDGSDSEQKEESESAESHEDLPMSSDYDNEEELVVSDEEEDVRETRSSRNQKKGNAKTLLRTSSRSNKFRSSMKELTERDIGYVEVLWSKRAASAPKRTTKKSRNSRSSTEEESDWSDEEEPDADSVQRHSKSPARPASRKEDNKEYKIQKLLASRTETRARWREICNDINTAEIHRGSRWFQDDDKNGGDDEVEERFLVKWSGLSFLHCSWESREDILDEIEGSQRFFTSFAQRSENGFIYSADERMDGDYFDPAFVEVDRILKVTVPKGFKPSLADQDDGVSDADFGIVTDSSNAKFEEGKGRIFLIKWGNTAYADITIECERDFILRDVEYKTKLKEFLLRNTKVCSAACAF
jgi:hypothetical protein